MTTTLRSPRGCWPCGCEAGGCELGAGAFAFGFAGVVDGFAPDFDAAADADDFDVAGFCVAADASALGEVFGEVDASLAIDLGGPEVGEEVAPCVFGEGVAFGEGVEDGGLAFEFLFGVDVEAFVGAGSEVEAVFEGGAKGRRDGDSPAVVECVVVGA